MPDGRLWLMSRDDIVPPRDATVWVSVMEYVADDTSWGMKSADWTAGRRRQNSMANASLGCMFTLQLGWEATFISVPVDKHKVCEQTLCALEQPTEGWRKTDAVASGAQPTAKRLAKQPSPNGLV